MRHAVILAIALLAAWAAWSGQDKMLLIVLGLASAAIVLVLALRMAVVDSEGVPFHLRHHILTYWGWLLVQIVQSNLQVARIVLTPSLPISPRLVRVKPLQRGDLPRVIFANSITLTPGTVTADLTAGRATVHALTEAIARDIEGGEMNRRVAAMEGRVRGDEES